VRRRWRVSRSERLRYRLRLQRNVVRNDVHWNEYRLQHRIRLFQRDVQKGERTNLRSRRRLRNQHLRRRDLLCGLLFGVQHLRIRDRPLQSDRKRRHAARHHYLRRYNDVRKNREV